jgi:hypothetical protein
MCVCQQCAAGSIIISVSRDVNTMRSSLEVHVMELLPGTLPVKQLFILLYGVGSNRFPWQLGINCKALFI